MSADAIRKAGGDDARLDALKLYAADPITGMKHWGELVEAWWRSILAARRGPIPRSAPIGHCAGRISGFGANGTSLRCSTIPGHMWFRTSVSLTASQAAQGTQLSLGNITEEDQTWVNGQFVAATFGYA